MFLVHGHPRIINHPIRRPQKNSEQAPTSSTRYPMCVQEFQNVLLYVVCTKNLVVERTVCSIYKNLKSETAKTHFFWTLCLSYTDTTDMRWSAKSRNKGLELVPLKIVWGVLVLLNFPVSILFLNIICFCFWWVINELKDCATSAFMCR